MDLVPYAVVLGGPANLSTGTPFTFGPSPTAQVSCNNPMSGLFADAGEKAPRGRRGSNHAGRRLTRRLGGKNGAPRINRWAPRIVPSGEGQQLVDRFATVINAR